MGLTSKSLDASKGLGFSFAAFFMSFRQTTSISKAPSTTNEITFTDVNNNVIYYINTNRC